MLLANARSLLLTRSFLARWPTTNFASFGGRHGSLTALDDALQRFQAFTNGLKFGGCCGFSSTHSGSSMPIQNPHLVRHRKCCLRQAGYWHLQLGSKCPSWRCFGCAGNSNDAARDSVEIAWRNHNNGSASVLFVT